MIKTAVIGYPIHHSKSPQIHTYWLKKYNLEGSYEAIEIPPENLQEKLQQLIDAGYAGFNVTVPHKETIFDLCHEVDETAKKVGAVNTVQVRDGKVYGTNTDVYGFVQNIKHEVPDFDFTAGKAIVLGAGGAARGVIKGLVDEGVPEILVLNRTKEKAEKLALDFKNVKIGDWDNRSDSLSEANMLINTTALGMSGSPALEIDISQLPQSSLVNDIVYAPLHTDLIQAAQKNGNRYVTGIGMLLHQARPAFELWFHKLPQVDEQLQELVLR